MTTERKAFIKAARKSPNDRLTPLVFADWLDERDDPLGSYIRAESELLAAPPGSRPWLKAIGKLIMLTERAEVTFGGWEYEPEVERTNRWMAKRRKLYAEDEDDEGASLQYGQSPSRRCCGLNDGTGSRYRPPTGRSSSAVRTGGSRAAW